LGINTWNPINPNVKVSLTVPTIYSTVSESAEEGTFMLLKGINVNECPFHSFFKLWRGVVSVNKRDSEKEI
jgi:hypothetical protein